MRVALAVALSALLLTACATPLVQQPPTQFASGPLPIHSVEIINYWQVHRRCGGHMVQTQNDTNSYLPLYLTNRPRVERIEECVIGNVLVLPAVDPKTGVTQEIQDALRSHGEGHLRRWKHKQ